jgi:hypothetical protein
MLRISQAIKPISCIILVLTCLSLSACGKSAPASTPTLDLTFYITPPKDFAEIRGTEKTRTYTLNGAAPKPGDPIIIVTRSSKVFEQEEVRREAPGVFMKNAPEFSNVANIVTTPTVATQLPGYQATADAQTKGVPVKVYCAEFFSTDCTYTILGYVGTDKATMIGDFKTSANSLNFK